MRQTSFKHGDNSCKQQQQEQWQRVGGAEVALQGGAKFHVVATPRIALHNSSSQTGSGSCRRPKSFPNYYSCAYTALHKCRTTQTHTDTHNCRRIICLIKKRLPPCSAQNYKDGRKNTQRDGGRETNNKQNSKNII